MSAHSCITCGDVATPMRVLAIGVEPGLARCGDGDGRSEQVETALVEPVRVGEWLLVHAGTALARASAQPATAADASDAAGGRAQPAGEASAASDAGKARDVREARA